MEYLILKNRNGMSSVFATDELLHAAEIGEAYSSNKSDEEEEMVIRILRVPPNPSWKDEICKIAETQNLPKNLYTLWIREDLDFAGGKFKPLKSNQCLSHQLTDVMHVSFEEQFLVFPGSSTSEHSSPRPY